jgi:hypothetical protein
MKQIGIVWWDKSERIEFQFDWANNAVIRFLLIFVILSWKRIFSCKERGSKNSGSGTMWYCRAG